MLVVRTHFRSLARISIRIGAPLDWFGRRSDVVPVAPDRCRLSELYGGVKFWDIQQRGCPPRPGEARVKSQRAWRKVTPSRAWACSTTVAPPKSGARACPSSVKRIGSQGASGPLADVGSLARARAGPRAEARKVKGTVGASNSMSGQAIASGCPLGHRPLPLG